MENHSDNPRIILVPVDFSKTGNVALQHASNLADAFGHEVLLLHIIDENLIASLFQSQSKDLDLVKLQEKMEALIAELKREKPGLKISKLIKEGNVSKAIVKVAEDYKCEAVVMGSHGASGIKQILGTIATRVVGSSEIPVVVVKKAPRPGYCEKIVVPIDLVKESKQKVYWANYVAKKFNSEVHVIAEQQTDPFLKKRSENSLRQVEKLLVDNGIKVYTKFTDDQHYPGHLGADALKFAGEINANLILIMTQEEEGIKEQIMGSFAQQIVSQSENIPVMTIKPKSVFKYGGDSGFYS